MRRYIAAGLVLVFIAVAWSALAAPPQTYPIRHFVDNGKEVNYVVLQLPCKAAIAHLSHGDQTIGQVLLECGLEK